MVKFAFNNVKLAGISSVVPVCEKNLLEEKNLYDGNEKKINRVINSSGFLKRRVTGEETTSDLCFQAAGDLIKNLKIDKNEIDALLFVSYTPDYLMPATSYVIHNKLGLSANCICMDIPQACSGFILGLYQAAMLINSGCKKVLLLVGDSFSKFSDMFNNNTAPVFGDAGTATLLEFDDKAEKMFFNINSDGSGYDSLICENGGFRNPVTSSDFYEDGKYMYKSKMDGGRIFDFTMNNVAPNIEDLLKYANLSVENLDEVIFHQANKFILENIARKLEIDPARVSTETLTNYGNQCGASIPCTISNTLREKVTNSNVKCLLSGFGVGLSWASAIININKIYCSELNDYRKED